MRGPVDTEEASRAVREASAAVETSGPPMVVGALAAELRASVTTLRLLIEGVHDGIVDVEQGSQDTSDMLTHVRVLSGLIEKLAGHTGADRGAMRPLPPRPLLRRWTAAMGPNAAAALVQLRVDAPPGLPAVYGDPRCLARLGLIVIDHAIRRTPAGGVVTVRSVAVPEAVLVEVADTGPGVMAIDRTRLLEVAPAGNDCAAQHGLPAARAIVTSHGGRLWMAESSVGAGVRLTLPAASRPHGAQPA